MTETCSAVLRSRRNCSSNTLCDDDISLLVKAANDKKTQVLKKEQKNAKNTNHTLKLTITEK